MKQTSRIILYLSFVLLITNSCKKPLYKIGQEYQGGIIFYIDSSDKHGLIAAAIDQGDSIEWGCESLNIIGSDETKVGSGLQNTIAIVNGCTSLNIAARVCYDLVLNGYDDWYLPSKDELYLLYKNKNAVGNFANDLVAPYWSSSQYRGDAAWRQLFGDSEKGEQTIYDKYNKYNVRAIRSF
jgi:Protein of unknown function (DUF1566)